MIVSLLGANAFASRKYPTARWSVLRALAATVCLASVVVTLSITSTAQAGSNLYCWGQVFASGADCTGAKHSLRQNWSQNYYGNQSFSVAASALTENWNQYGSWVYGYGSVCHSYSGLNLLYPWMYNSDYRTQTMGGIEYWGSEPACP